MLIPSEKTKILPEQVIDFIDSIMDHERMINSAGSFFDDDPIIIEDEDAEEFELYKEEYYHIKSEMQKLFIEFSSGKKIKTVSGFNELMDGMKEVFEYMNFVNKKKNSWE